MDEVRVEVVAQRDAGNRGARFGALLNDSSFEGFGVGTAGIEGVQFFGVRSNYADTITLIGRGRKVCLPAPYRR